MCDVLNDLEAAGVSRRRILASFGLASAATVAAAAVPAHAGADPSTGPRKFGPAPHQNARTRLVLLGTAGGPAYWPGTQRAGIASALVVEDRFYLIDAGHGVVRQMKEAKLGPNYDTDGDGPLDVLAGVFLTHLHSDHIVDLTNVLFTGLFNGLQHVNKIPIWGPGNRGELHPLFGPGPAPAPVNPANPTPGTRESLDYLVQAFATDLNDRLFDNRRPRPDALWEAHDVPVPAEYTRSPNTDPHPAMDPFVFFEDDRVKVSATLVDHAPAFPALAYRFDTDDGSVVFSGDTARSQNLIRLAKDADVLVHEVIDEQWAADLVPEPRTEDQEGLYRHLIEAHTLINEVGPIAQEANASTLVLSHLVPGNRPDRVWEACAEGFDGRLIIGHDLDVIGVGGPRKRR